MKTYNNLFEKIYSFENLHLAYLKARKGKRYRKEILNFSYNLEKNLLQIKEELKSQTYQHGKYREFTICDLKKRYIKAAPFRDRVIHHALHNVIETIFDRGFIYDSYACRTGKGTHKAVKRLQMFIKSIADFKNTNIENKEKQYCLQCDISKYFNSINHIILLKIIKKKIVDKKVLWLIEEILNSSQEKPDTGIPIGNLTSQLFANIYLNELDIFAKHRLKSKYYLRYMDDFIILTPGKNRLYRNRGRIRKFLQKELKLESNPKKGNIFLINKGVDFLGYRIFRNYKLLRKITVARFAKRVKFYQRGLNKNVEIKEKFNAFLQSWLAYACFANSWKLRNNLSLISC
jgi:RNA-directed DNA polymerase